MEMFLPHLPLLLADGNQGGQWTPLIMFFVMIVVLYYFVVIRGQRRERERREAMLNSLKKNDRVITIGGIIGTVASTSANGKEVILKVDDNARIKVLRSAIQGPLKDQDETSQEASAGKEKSGSRS